MKVPTTCETDRDEVRLKDHQKSIKEKHDSQGSNSTMTVDGLTDAALMGALHDTVQRYGGAIGEHFVGLTGVDNLRNQTWVRGLVDIANSKVNPDYEYQNIHQQAGFSAEVKTVVRQNAEARIQGDATRTMRTDDLGRVNDQLYDTVKLDENGGIIEGSGTQVKFIGYSENDPFNEGSASRAYQKLMSDKFAKYHENNVLIEVPKDQYDNLIAETDKNIGKLHNQLERVTDSEVKAKLEAKLERAETLRQNLRQSSVTSEEAVFAREHPYLSTAKDMGLVAHRAGMEAAEFGAIIGGSVAVVQQTVALRESGSRRSGGRGCQLNGKTSGPKLCSGSRWLFGKRGHGTSCAQGRTSGLYDWIATSNGASSH